MPDPIRIPPGSLSVVIPAYNEAVGIGMALESLSAYLNGCLPDYEVVVVDDGSCDKTALTVENWIEQSRFGSRVRLVRLEQNQGKGSAVRAGVFECRKDWIVFMDADCPFELSAFEGILAAFQAGAQVVAGTRVWPGAHPRAGVPWVRYLSGNAYSLLIQVFISPGIWDTQCGLKGFSAQTARCLFSRITLSDFAFDVELLFLARKYGCVIRQVRVKMANVRRESRVRLVRDSLRMLVDLFRIRRNDVLGRYDEKRLLEARQSERIGPFTP